VIAPCRMASAYSIAESQTSGAAMLMPRLFRGAEHTLGVPAAPQMVPPSQFPQLETVWEFPQRSIATRALH